MSYILHFDRLGRKKRVDIIVDNITEEEINPKIRKYIPFNVGEIYISGGSGCFWTNRGSFIFTIEEVKIMTPEAELEELMEDLRKLREDTLKKMRGNYE